MFRREQACRRITTRHHQGCFRHRAAVAQHPVQPDAIVRLRVQIHRLDRIEQPALPDFRFPIAAGIAARHPCPLRPARFGNPVAPEQFLDRALEDRRQCQRSGNGRRKAFALDGADCRARDAGTLRQFRLRPMASLPPLAYRVECHLPLVVCHFHVTPRQIKKPRPRLTSA